MFRPLTHSLSTSPIALQRKTTEKQSPSGESPLKKEDHSSAAIRYLAYTNDVGEAFRPIVPLTIVRLAYAISWSYIIGDIVLEGRKETQKGSSRNEVSRTVSERAVFQTLASMALPALTIHTQVALFGIVFKRVGRYQYWGPTISGLVLIPILPVLYDRPVEYITQKVFNNLWPHEIQQLAMPHPLVHLTHS
eukprot:TRINITY_DN13069_c0_g1_i1.p1 TRINITY_DN13069_c0_g1~~TRINITY_DN13069_c0_g1_i1.p1  ORF type:complete len:206 (+),score=4.21 TRINITY_DN13069_c0_g1_i1:43-618(+)